MKTANNTRSRGQVYSVGNYLMTGKVLGKGHFARVEEATHRIIGKKVAIKIIDLTCIKEEYARRNLHREPRVMAKLRHPCIAALYETMMILITLALYGSYQTLVGQSVFHNVAQTTVSRSVRQVTDALNAIYRNHIKWPMLPAERNAIKAQCLLMARALQYDPITAAKIVNACCVLHYIANQNRAPLLPLTPAEAEEENQRQHQHGPRLYVVMEAAGGGDLCAHVLAARGPARGLPEARARALAAQLVSAVRHMHARGVVHRDLKMENIMLDCTKQFIKIVDFGLSNMWSSGGALRTPCGSLEYAAPELFVDGRRYGPEVDLWSIGVIVYGMVTGGLPFTGADAGSGRSRPQLRAAIARGFTRKQRAALTCVSNECKMFVQQLLEPNVEMRMKIEEAARHRWVKRPGMKMKVHPLGSIDPKVNREIYKQIADLCGQTVIDAVAQIKAEPFGSVAGIYNIKTHLHQIQAASGVDLLWSSNTQEVRPISPPEYKPGYEMRPETTPSSSKAITPPPALTTTQTAQRKMVFTSSRQNGVTKVDSNHTNGPTTASVKAQTGSLNVSLNGSMVRSINAPRIPQRSTVNTASQVTKDILNQPKVPPPKPFPEQRNFRIDTTSKTRYQQLQSPRFGMMNRPITGSYGLKKQVYKVYDSGDCGLDPRLPSIDEHSNTDLNDKNKKARPPFVRRVNLEEERRLNSCPNKMGDGRRNDFYTRGGDGLPSWRATGATTTSTRILLQSNATTIKRASLGNIVSPHSSTNSQCKSERAMPVGWLCTRSPASKESPLQRLRRTAPMK